MAVQRAAQDAMVEYLRALEELRRSFVLAEDKHQFTCLHYAIRDAYAGCFPILRLLLSSCFEFPEGREVDELMRHKRFQLQPGLTSLFSYVPDLFPVTEHIIERPLKLLVLCEGRRGNA
ncbi:unnamed protein product [Durusdinium trenchii]|uniref:Uncharacterized protein n=1 Tax=Durusdinium trenchii TaxID=1381693 RepID=A0ABP0M105_9DINO